MMQDMNEEKIHEEIYQDDSSQQIIQEVESQQQEFYEDDEDENVIDSQSEYFEGVSGVDMISKSMPVVP